MKYGIEFEFFVSKDKTIIPAYLATNNLDGNPFLGEIKTEPFDNITDCVFDLKKRIFLEKNNLNKKGFELEIIPVHQFSNNELIEFRKNKSAIDKKEYEVLEEFSIYPGNKLGKLLKRGEIKASLQINFSEHNSFSYPTFSRISIDEKYKYEEKTKEKSYSCLFNYVNIIQKLDALYKEDISKTKRVKGVYTIKAGDFGDRIEYRSLPNTIDITSLIKTLEECKNI